MFEPHLEISMPSTIAMLASSFRAGDTEAEKVVVLEQVFGNLQNQTYIRDLCIAAHREAGVRLFMVEGATGPVTIPSNAGDIGVMMQSHFEVSAGVLAAADAARGRISIVGVDDLQRHQTARHAQQELNVVRPTVEMVFRRIADALRNAQRRVYPRAVRRMQFARLPIYGPEPGLRDRLDTVRRAAKAVGADLRPFRLLLRANQAAVQDGDFDQDRVVNEQKQFFGDLLRAFQDSWEQLVQNRNIQPFLPFIEFWLRKIGRTNREFEADFTRNPASIGECRMWLENWFASSAHDARDGTTESFMIIEEFMRLALLVNVPYFQFSHLRRVIAQNRESSLVGEAITRNLDQMVNCTEAAEAIIDCLGDPRARALNRLEEQFELRRRALLMELIPLEAARIEIAPGDLTRLIGTLSAEIDFFQSLATGAHWQEVDAALAHARDFYRSCIERSAQMAAETLRLVRERGHDRAVLAVGGFHPDVINRHFESDRRVSFSVVRPMPSL